MATRSENHPKSFSTGTYIVGIIAIILLMVIPLIFVQGSEFGGADGLGAEMVTQIAPAYDSEWATNLWEPPGGETESLLFALQATIGGILIGYFFGYFRGRKYNSQR